MATQLTGFSKFILTLLIVGGIGLGLRYFLNNTQQGQDLKKNAENATNSTSNNSGNKKNGGSANNDPNTIKVGVVTWGGYAGGQYFNEGFEASEQSRFYKDYGIKAEFKVIDDFNASREAWKADEVDLLWTTADAFPTEVTNLKQFEPQVIFQADWSRGGDAIVAQRTINTVADLKGKKIAVAPMTPSHTFLIWMLQAGNLKMSDINVVEAPSAIDAAQYFKSGTVDAAVVWSPDDEDCIKSVAGSKILKSTKSASNIIADVFIAKKAYAEKNKDKLQKFVEGWLRGAAEINASDLNKRKAAKILASGLNMPEEYCYKAINNTRLATYGDNVNFFNLNGNYNGVKGEDIYSKMTKEYKALNYADPNTPAWRSIANTNVLRGITTLNTPENQAEAQTSFATPTASDKTAKAFSSKPVTITYSSASATLDENAKRIIDLEFADIAKAFGNARVRIEGNTDNTGNTDQNVILSQKRAQAVATYLSQQYNMDIDKFVIVGNGSAKPIADNTTEQGKAKNRRTEFQILAD